MLKDVGMEVPKSIETYVTSKMYREGVKIAVLSH